MANTTINERPQAKALRAEMNAEQERRRMEEARVAAAHRGPGGGPQFSGGTETQPQPVRPTISRG